MSNKKRRGWRNMKWCIYFCLEQEKLRKYKWNIRYRFFFNYKFLHKKEREWRKQMSKNHINRVMYTNLYLPKNMWASSCFHFQNDYNLAHQPMLKIGLENDGNKKTNGKWRVYCILVCVFFINSRENCVWVFVLSTCLFPRSKCERMIFFFWREAHDRIEITQNIWF